MSFKKEGNDLRERKKWEMGETFSNWDVNRRQYSGPAEGRIYSAHIWIAWGGVYFG